MVTFTINLEVTSREGVQQNKILLWWYIKVDNLTCFIK